MKREIVIVTGDHVLRVQHDVWVAFLKVASLVVDTGDMYPHLEKHLGEQLLDKVKEVKYTLDDHCSSS